MNQSGSDARAKRVAARLILAKTVTNASLGMLSPNDALSDAPDSDDYGLFVKRPVLDFS